MLQIFNSSYGVDLSKLQQVYSESGNSYFYEDTLDFLLEDRCVYAVWCVDGCYVSALRWQPYLDGFLIAGVETRPDAKRRGYARQLLRAVLVHFAADGKRIVYSHIDKHNQASIRLHHNCGFEKSRDYARLLDGSVSHEYRTFRIEI